MPFFILDAVEAIDGFFATGGPVLYLIGAVTFLMWVLILERFWYYFINYHKDAERAISRWEQCPKHRSWVAHAIRDKLISETHIRIEHNLAAIKTLIAICPLCGLLGTVTGMIDVFSVLAISGGGDIKTMAGGVSRATIPTMAGMVSALSGLFANIYVAKKADRERALIGEHLTMDHRP